MALSICIVALDDPWAMRHGGTLRTRAFVDAFIAAGIETHVVYVERESKRDMEPPLAACLHPISSVPVGERQTLRVAARLKRRYLPVPTTRGARLSAVAAAVRASEANVVLVSQLRAVQYVSPGQRLWFDQSDVLSELIKPEIEARRGLSRITARAQRAVVLRDERAALARADVATVAGYSDAALPSSVSASATWLPTPVDVPVSVPAIAGPPTIGFLANFRFWPNRDGFEMLRRYWAPQLVALGWRVVVAGYESDSLPATAGIEVVGPVREVATFYSNVSAALAPIRLGAGIKVKIIESLLYRRKVLATPAAVAGLPPELARLISVSPDGAELPANFSFGNDADWIRAYEMAQQLFAPSTFEAAVARILDRSVTEKNP